MKRAAIVTITNGGLNFGNRLQNYALQTVLQRHNVRPETIFTAVPVRNSLVLSHLRRTAKHWLKREGRFRCFERFNRRHILPAPRARYSGLNDESFGRGDRYAAFLAGSDQVWNPHFYFNSDFEFLTFAPPELRYSYAASFGVGEIPHERREDFARRLGAFQALSVRERTGADIVRELTGREAEVHLDPTLLLTAADYAGMAEPPPHPLPERYALAYFLGEQGEACREFVREVSRRTGLPVVEFNEKHGTPLYHIGPQHFLHLLSHAGYVCTDSFHGTAFSILFRRPFTVFLRRNSQGDMRSRIDTLLDVTGLENRLFGVRSAPESLEPVPFEAAHRRIEAERRAADEYFRRITARW